MLQGLLLLGVVVAMWAPFGVGTLPHGDGWILRDRIAKGAGWVWLDQPTRMFIYLPWTLADLISPRSFIGAHLVLMAAMWTKAVALLGILRRLAVPAGFALLAAVLLTVNSASTLVISLDAPLDRHVALALFLVSVWLFLVTVERPRVALLGGMVAVQALALWSIETIVPLAFLAPLILLWRPPEDRRKALRAVGTWLVLPTAAVAHNIFQLGFAAQISGSPFGRSHARETLALGDGIGAAVASLMHALHGHFFDLWTRSFRALPDVGWLAGIAIAVAAASVIVARLARPELPTWRDIRGLAIAGTAAFLAVAVPMSVTRLRLDSGRTWVLSSLGATFLLIAVAAVAGRVTRRAWVAHGLLAVMIALGAGGLLAQHGLYAQRSELLRATLGSVVEKAPGLEPETLVVLVFDRGVGDRPPGISIRSGVLTHALRFIYDDTSLLGCVAVPPGWMVQDAVCHFDDGRVVARFRDDGAERSFPYSRVVALSYLGDGGVSVIEELSDRVPPEVSADYRPGRRILISSDVLTRADDLGLLPARRE